MVTFHDGMIVIHGLFGSTQTAPLWLSVGFLTVGLVSAAAVVVSRLRDR